MLGRTGAQHVISVARFALHAMQDVDVFPHPGMCWGPHPISSWPAEQVRVGQHREVRGRETGMKLYFCHVPHYRAEAGCGGRELGGACPAPSILLMKRPEGLSMGRGRGVLPECPPAEELRGAGPGSAVPEEALWPRRW